MDAQPKFHQPPSRVSNQDDVVSCGLQIIGWDPSNSEAIASTDEYAGQAQAIAANVPADADPETVDWLPLGVFALTQKDGDVEDATLFMQLAISKALLREPSRTPRPTGPWKSRERSTTKVSVRRGDRLVKVGQSWRQAFTTLPRMKLAHCCTSPTDKPNSGQWLAWTSRRTPNKISNAARGSPYKNVCRDPRLFLAILQRTKACCGP